MKRARPWWWALTAVAAIVLAVLPAAVGANDDEDLRKSPLDVQVALLRDGRCGEFAQSLPPLFVEVGLEPGDETNRVEVCVRNGGRQAGRLSLAVIDRVESEVACSAEEPAVDETCAADALGELGESLVVDVGSTARCRRTGSAVGVFGFAALETTPETVLAQMRARATECVALRVGFAPSSDEAATAGQTDRVTWRFAFDLSN